MDQLTINVFYILWIISTITKIVVYCLKRPLMGVTGATTAATRFDSRPALTNLDVSTKKNFICIAQHFGFKNLKAKYFYIAGISTCHTAFVLFKKTISGEKTNLYNELVVPPMQKVKSFFSQPVVKNLVFGLSKL